MRRNQQDSAGETFRPRFELIKFCQSNREAWKKGYSLQESFVKQKWPNFYPTVYSTICCILRAALAQNLWWMRDTLEMEAIVWTTLCRAGQGRCPCITVAHPSDVQSCLTLSDSTDCSPLGFSVHGDFPGKNIEGNGVPFPPPGDLPNPGIKPESPVSPALQEDSLALSHLGTLEIHRLIRKVYVSQVSKHSSLRNRTIDQNSK